MSGTDNTWRFSIYASTLPLSN
ncbi:BnaCnng13290D [Brassica napus]|uniref:BnaCnng13290D protein n=1 Tax=Brassica napus TaxID=3708 RepID=A0A078I6Z5_BRANA|nr:BnaCnng13290D [Brassica napus]